jgi:hypothetical protein
MTNIGGRVRPAGALLISLLFASACAAPPIDPHVETGWSRAPDLSVYAGMRTAGELAREQEILCWSRDPASVVSRWRSVFGAREDWIAAALVHRYGIAAVAAYEPVSPPREPCPEIIDDEWERHYARLLRLLELRLYPRESWSAS